MQHDRSLSLFDGQRLALLSTPKSSSVFQYKPDSKTFDLIAQPTAADQQWLTDAIAFYQTGYTTFEKALKHASSN